MITPRGGLLEIRGLDPVASGTRVELPHPLIHLRFGAKELMVIDEKGTIAAFTPDGSYMAEPGPWSTTPIRRRFADPPVAWDGPNDRVFTLLGNRDGLIPITGWDRRWADHSFEVPRGEGSSPPWALAVDPAGKLLATCGPEGTITVRDLDTGSVRADARHGKALGNLLSVAFRPDGSLLATAGSDGKVRAWDLGLDRPLLVAPGPKRDIRAVAFDRDRLTVVSGAHRLGPLMIDHYDVSALSPGP